MPEVKLFYEDFSIFFLQHGTDAMQVKQTKKIANYSKKISGILNRMRIKIMPTWGSRFARVANHRSGRTAL